jgi:uncharacterized protein YbjT (DUF2867 family)
MPQNKSALILGATGLVGGELLALLLDHPDYERVRVLVRRSLHWKHPKMEEHVIDFDRLDKERDLFEVDEVFCCLGTTRKKAGSAEAFRKVDLHYPVTAATLAKAQGARFFIITAVGANSRSLFFYNRVKGEVEEKLKQLDLPALHIFRPSLLLGKRMEFRLGEEFAAVFARLLRPVFTGVLGPYRPVKALDVAKAMVWAAQMNEKGMFVHPSHEIEKMASNIHINRETRRFFAI